MDILMKRKISEITGNRTSLLETDGLFAVLTDEKCVPDKIVFRYQ